MSALQIARAPPPALPAAFLLAALAWGLLAALGFALLGEQVLASRWSPAALLLTHALTLGLLGNALLGGLLQFMPAAAGTAASAGLGLWLLVALNLGTLLLLLHFAGWLPALPAALVLGCGLVPAALWLQWVARAARPPALAQALQGSLLLLGLCGVLGIGLLAARGGSLVFADRLLVVDMHGLVGLWGAALGLLLAVSSQVLPMLQGCARWRPSSLRRLLGLVLLALLVALWLRAHAYALVLPLLAAMALMLAVLYLRALGTAPHRRNAPLRAAWLLAALGAGVGVAAAVWLAQGGAEIGLPLAVFLLLVVLPLLVVAMAMEILAFLAWIGLQRRLGRGHGPAPGVHRLLEDRRKWQVLALLAAGGLLLVPALAGASALRATAALLIATAHALALWAGLSAFARARRHLRSIQGVLSP